MRELRQRRDFSPKALRVLAGIFGKLELRFTRTRCYSTFDVNTKSNSYVVVAKDRSSVVIRSPDLLTGESRITHMHFDGAHFWVNVGTGAVREFFKRLGLSDNTSTSRPRRKAKSKKRSRAARG